jgi:predicted alpha/beta superfamily hydrolase
MIKTCLFALLGLCATTVSAHAGNTPPPASPAFPPYVLGGTEVRPLPRSADGRDYLLYVKFPASYAAHPERRYPVVYLCDGYWGFTLLNAVAGALDYDRVAPEFIVVGLGYAGENLDYGKMRLWELAPIPAPDNPDTGHADRFLAALETQIIPTVERDYRGDPSQRILMGSSLGGAFTLYSLFHKPDLFAGYIAISPSVDYQNWAFREENAFAKAHPQLAKRLFISVGTCEWTDYVAHIQAFDRQLRSHTYNDLAYQFRLIDGERHGTTNAEATTLGLRFIFEPLAPETGVQTHY